MPEAHKKNSKPLKYYHFIILSCVLCVIFIINSNHVNKERFLKKYNQVKNGIYENIKTLRNLQDSSINYSNKVCSKASDDLIEYYKTGDPSKIDIDSNEITYENKNEPYMEYLIAIVKNIGNDDNDSGGNSLQKSATDYGMRFIPMMIFLSFGLLGIFGWIICCFCACCNCCCCCCCKKPQCKKVCFIFTYAFYAGVVGVSIFGLAVTSKAFRGLNDTGCSFLKFFEQILDGEIEQNKSPRWSGANKIKNLLLELEKFISESDTNAHNNIAQSFENLYNKESYFLNYMRTSSNDLYNNLNDYSKEYTNFQNFANDQYILDIIYSYGNFSGTSFPNDSILYQWDKEYHLVSDNAMSYLIIANDSFDYILNNKVSDVKDQLDRSASKINKIIKPFEDLNEDLGKIFDELSQYGDNYGKMSLHSIFTVLMVININLAGFILLICFCSMKQCTSCCCCRCLLKCVTHLSWNILALMMICSFLFGSLLGIIGMIGGDMMSLVSYILSKENFNNEKLFIDKFDEVAEYLKIFIHGDGDISTSLDLGNSLNSFNNISHIQENIRTIRENFSNIISECRVYNDTINWLNSEKEYETDIYLIPSKKLEDQSRENISYHNFLEKINEKFQDTTQKFSWNFTNHGNECGSSSSDRTVFDPKSCPPLKIINDLALDNVELKQYAEILNDTDTFIRNANSLKEGSFLQILNNLTYFYLEYLSQFNLTLIVFDDIIENLMSRISQYIGNENNIFSILNGKFTQINVKIILKCLKDALGKNIFSIGLSLNIVGCALILSISSTLILLAIINEELNQHIKTENTPGIASLSELKLNNVSPFQPQNMLPA